MSRLQEGEKQSSAFKREEEGKENKSSSGQVPLKVSERSESPASLLLCGLISLNGFVCVAVLAGLFETKQKKPVMFSLFRGLIMTRCVHSGPMKQTDEE